MPASLRRDYTGGMKFVFASDSFKGSLSSERIGALLCEAAREACPDAECVTLLLADGGEGTLDAIARVRPGSRVSFRAHDALMRPMQGRIFVGNGATPEAFVETAQTCGLALLRQEERNPLATSSYGIGESIRRALDAGAGKITVGLGGSSTNDAGMGCMRALGARFLDARGRELAGCGADLGLVDRILLEGLDERLRDAQLTLMCDVSNPLLGPSGATRVFGGQKGADATMLDRLEAGMSRYAQTLARVFPDVVLHTPGYGAAGGLGMALAVFLGARVESGIEAMLRWTDFDRIIADADVVVTGEGQMDDQSLHGKAVSGVLAHARRQGIPVAAICGRLAGDRDALLGLGFSHVLESGAGQELDYAMAHAEENYARAARQLFRLIVR